MQRKLTVYCGSFYGLLEINMTEKKMINRVFFNQEQKD